jgi:hypothetical protein
MQMAFMSFWLSAGKHFTQEIKCEQIVFGYDDVCNRPPEHPGVSRLSTVNGIQKASEDPGGIFGIEQPGVLIIVEGEMDKLACNQVSHLHLLESGH